MKHLRTNPSKTKHARLNIYIPADLNERLQPYKASLNLSAICSAALEREIARIENVLGGNKSIDALSNDEVRSLLRALLVKMGGTE